jgi:hypothetical protein
MKIEGSGSESGSRSVSQRHGSADPDPDPHQNVLVSQHWLPEDEGQKKVCEPWHE